jgi:hypothetical protein
MGPHADIVPPGCPVCGASAFGVVERWTPEEASWDGVGELWFDSAEDAERAFSTEPYLSMPRRGSGEVPRRGAVVLRRGAHRRGSAFLSRGLRIASRLVLIRRSRGQSFPGTMTTAAHEVGREGRLRGLVRRLPDEVESSSPLAVFVAVIGIPHSNFLEPYQTSSGSSARARSTE